MAECARGLNGSYLWAWMTAPLAPGQIKVRDRSLAVASACHISMSQGVFNLAEIRGTQLHLCSRNVLVQPLNAASSGNGNDPWLLSEHPGQCELRRR